jgi:hypothetical protein
VSAPKGKLFDIPRPLMVAAMDQSSNPFKYHFFVSYTTREGEVQAALPYVKEFVRGLENHGFRAWPFWLDLAQIHDPMINRNEELEALLRDGVHTSTALLAFCSPGYFTSYYCKLEWEEARLTCPSDECFSLAVLWKRSEGIPDCAADMLPRMIEIVDMSQSEWQRAFVQARAFLYGCHERRQIRWDLLHP